MSPITHLLVGWLVAQVPSGIQRRERAIIALAGIAPDLDGLGIVAEVLTEHSDTPLLWYWQYHHTLLHNLGGAFLMAVVAALLATRRRWLVVLLAEVSFHLHLLGDIVGSKGPEGHQWPIPYLLPFSDSWQLTWSGQWELDAWQNLAITAVCIGATLLLAVRRGYSPVELVSLQMDAALVTSLRSRFRSSEE